MEVENEDFKGGIDREQLEPKQNIQEYRVRKKKIWKGKIAPKGYIFLVVDFKRKDLRGQNHEYTYSHIVEGDCEEDEFTELARIMYESLCKKFHLTPR